MKYVVMVKVYEKDGDTLRETHVSMKEFVDVNNLVSFLNQSKDARMPEKGTRRQQILDTIKEKPGMTESEINEMFPVSISPAIRSLLKEGLITRKGKPFRYHAIDREEDVEDVSMPRQDTRAREVYDFVSRHPRKTSLEISEALGYDASAMLKYLVERYGVKRTGRGCRGSPYKYLNQPRVGSPVVPKKKSKKKKESKKKSKKKESKKKKKSKKKESKKKKSKKKKSKKKKSTGGMKEEVLEKVRILPGSTAREVADAVGKDASPYLTILAKENKVTRIKRDGKYEYYAVNDPDSITKKQVLALVEKNPGLTTKEIRVMLGLPEKKNTWVYNTLREMSEKGRVERSGTPYRYVRMEA